MIPEKIHFCGRDYLIEEVEELDGRDSWGRTQLGSGKIFLEKDVPHDKKVESLIHELMHIAFRSIGGGNLSRKQEENIIEPWAINLFGILKDNNLLNI